MNKSIVFGAATLLLAVAAATTIVMYNLDRMFSEYQGMFSHDKAKFGLQHCINMQMYLDKHNTLSTHPPDMLEQLKAIMDKPENELQREFATRLLSYTDPDCAKIQLDEFLAIFTMCGGLDRFEPFENFLGDYGITKIEHCSDKMLMSLHKDKKKLLTRMDALRAVLKKAKIIVNKHSVEEMLTLASENPIPEVMEPCQFFQSDVFLKMGTINVALALEVIREDKVESLAPKLPLFRKCAIFCVKYIHKEKCNRLMESDEDCELINSEGDSSLSSILR